MFAGESHSYSYFISYMVEFFYSYFLSYMFEFENENFESIIICFQSEPEFRPPMSQVVESIVSVLEEQM